MQKSRVVSPSVWQGSVKTELEMWDVQLCDFLTAFQETEKGSENSELHLKAAQPELMTPGASSRN